MARNIRWGSQKLVSSTRFARSGRFLLESQHDSFETLQYPCYLELHMKELIYVEAFPFGVEDWTAVSEAARHVVNATFAEDEILRASKLIDLLEVLDDLQAKYGTHPILLETEADFINDDNERVSLYLQAIELATTHNLPTLSIRLSLAGLLVDLERFAEANTQLLACENELSDVDESERKAWEELSSIVQKLNESKTE